MKKNLLVILIGITILACSLSPSASPTQSVDVVFRSPRDMNLQPRDVPDLEEVPVEEPSDVALLPEAIDQDQRAYISVEQNIYIESSVIMVPERTTRQPREVADEIIKYRNSRMRISGSERSSSVGEKAIIIGITGYCSSKYSDGFILVFYRNNIIVVIIACGNVDEEYVRFIAAKIENNVKAPPAPEELAGAETEQAVLNPQDSLTSLPSIEPTVQPTADMCESLTPEECANNGLHFYSYSTIDEIYINTTSSNHDFCLINDQGTIGHSFNFTGDGLFVDSYQIKINKIGENTYIEERTKKSGSQSTTNEKLTYIFNTSGFVLEHIVISNDPSIGQWGCKITSTYILND